MVYSPYKLEDVHEASAQEKFKVISTFAGGGGSSTGYRLAGGKVLVINEFVEEAQKTYAKNYPDTVILPGDIKELTGKDFLDAAGVGVGEIDILDGSPPCSAFSVSGSLSHNIHEEEHVDLWGNVTIEKVPGKHSDGWSKTKNYSDGKKVENIEDLFFEFLRVAKEIKPKVIVAENVKGLTVGEAKEYFNKILNEFENIGYEVCAQVLDSRYYGVSQTRTRVIFIGVREDVAKKAGYNFMNISQVFPEPDKEVIPVKDVMVGLEYDSEEVKYLTDKWIKTAYWKQTGSKMPTDPDKVLTGMDYHPKGHHFNLKRVSQYQPCPTITAMGSAETTAGAFHWIEPRKLTLGELKRIMSLPDDFKLTGKWNQKAERCGRMVPPLMMERIASSIYEKVLEKYND
ncbi:MAG: DNA (cytosine-5-)-methyltransferase [Candidatus Pacebacteria bacterium]|nr:DNA (cytosine-5-)-methyltransferase [Candidatus Paceibacterota bacterium]